MLEDNQYIVITNHLASKYRKNGQYFKIRTFFPYSCYYKGTPLTMPSQNIINQVHLEMKNNGLSIDKYIHNINCMNCGGNTHSMYYLPVYKNESKNGEQIFAKITKEKKLRHPSLSNLKVGNFMYSPQVGSCSIVLIKWVPFCENLKCIQEFTIKNPGCFIPYWHPDDINDFPDSITTNEAINNDNFYNNKLISNKFK